jgi:hypothetical protein
MSMIGGVSTTTESQKTESATAVGGETTGTSTKTEGSKGSDTATVASTAESTGAETAKTTSATLASSTQTSTAGAVPLGGQGVGAGIAGVLGVMAYGLL